MKKAFETFLKLFFYIIVGVFIFKILSPLYHSFIIRGDSLSTHWIGESSFLEFFTKSDHSWFLMSLFYSMGARFIPELLKIHPMTWFSHYYYIAMFAIMYLLQYSIVRNFTKYFKNKTNTVLWVFITFPVFCSFLKQIDVTWIVADDCWSYAYLFLPLFFIVFWSNIETLYVKNTILDDTSSRKIAIYKYSVLFLLFLCVAVSHEFMRFIVCFSVLIGYILHCLFINSKINHKKFFISYLLIVFANVAIFFTDTFSVWFKERILSLSSISAILPYYLENYFENVLVENRILIALILIFMVLISRVSCDNEKKENKKVVIFAFSTLLSVLIFPLVTIVGQDYSQFSCNHCGIGLMIKIFLFNILLSLCGWLVCTLKLNSFKFYTLLLCFVPLLLGVKSLFFGYDFVLNLNYHTKKRIFILERIFELYGKKEKVFFNSYDVEGTVSNYALFYFIYLYDRGGNFDDYRQVDVCFDKEHVDNCDKKLINFLKEKTGYELTEEEIEKMDFQKYYRY